MTAKLAIQPFKNRTGTTSYRLSGSVPGWVADRPGVDRARIRENYPNQHEALGAKQTYEAKAANIDTVPMVQTRLTKEKVQEAERCFSELEAAGARTMTEAVRFFIANYREPVTRCTLIAAKDLFLSERTQGNLRADTMRNLKSRVGQFVNSQPEGQLVSDVLPEHINRFLNRTGKRNRGPRSIRNDRLALSAFFQWCGKDKKQFTTDNPAKRAMTIKVENAEPQVLPLGSIRKLLATSQQYRDGHCTPYLVLALFCAVRPRELSRLTWQNLDLKSKTVTIGAGAAKTRTRRVVSIPDNALEWLTPFELKHPTLKISRKSFDTVRKLAGILKGWQGDVLRHTGISHHLAKHNNEGLTASWAGNSPDVIHGSYKGLISKPSDTDEFWAITPESVSAEIIDFQKVA